MRPLVALHLLCARLACATALSATGPQLASEPQDLDATLMRREALPRSLAQGAPDVENVAGGEEVQDNSEDTYEVPDYVRPTDRESARATPINRRVTVTDDDALPQPPRLAPTQQEAQGEVDEESQNQQHSLSFRPVVPGRVGLTDQIAGMHARSPEASSETGVAAVAPKKYKSLSDQMKAVREAKELEQVAQHHQAFVQPEAPQEGTPRQAVAAVMTEEKPGGGSGGALASAPVTVSQATPPATAAMGADAPMQVLLSTHQALQRMTSLAQTNREVGPAGPPGPPGLAAGLPDVAASQTGPVTVLPDDLSKYQGPPGFTGQNGTQGEQGPPGSIGPPGKDGIAMTGPPGSVGEVGSHGAPGTQGAHGPSGPVGEPGEDWDGVREGAEMLSLSKDLLRKVDTVAQSHDESSTLLLMQMRMLEKQIGLDEKDLLLSVEDYNRLKGLERNIVNLTGKLKESEEGTFSAVGKKELAESDALKETEHAERALKRYGMGVNGPHAPVYEEPEEKTSKNSCVRVAGSAAVYVVTLLLAN